MFEHAWRVKSPRRGVFCRPQDLHAFAIVPAFAEFLDNGKAHGADIRNAFDELIGSARNAPALVGLLLESLVLNQAQMCWPRHHLHTRVGQGLESRDADVLNLHGEDVQVAPKRHHSLRVLQVALHKPRRQMATRGFPAGVHDFNAHIPIHRLLDHHAAELATAQHPEAQGRSDRREGGRRRRVHAAKILVVCRSQAEFVRSLNHGIFD